MKTITITIGILLLNICFTNGQFLTNNEIRFIKKNAINIHVDSLYSNGQWKPILQQLKNKNIVLLGEFSHGAKEVAVSRNDLIRNLHKTLEFDVILFEAGIGEIAEIDLNKNSLNSKQMLNGFIGVWKTKEFESLMQYIKENQISISGFDIQRSGMIFNNLLNREASNYNVDIQLLNTLEKRYTQINKKIKSKDASFSTLKEPVLRLVHDYKIIDSSFKKAALKHKPIPKAYLLLRKTIANRIAYLKYRLEFLKNGNWIKRWESRDQAMAKNIVWLIDNFYHNKKVIVIGHNFHISRFNKKQDVMGKFLKLKYRDAMYSLATYTGKGAYHDNYKNIKSIEPIASNHIDIKHVFNFLDNKIHFINIPEKSKKSTSWFFKDIIISDTFIDLFNSKKLILHKCFDGLLLIDKVTPPE